MTPSSKLILVRTSFQNMDGSIFICVFHDTRNYFRGEEELEKIQFSGWLESIREVTTRLPRWSKFGLLGTLILTVQVANGIVAMNRSVCSAATSTRTRSSRTSSSDTPSSTTAARTSSTTSSSTSNSTSGWASALPTRTRCIRCCVTRAIS